MSSSPALSLPTETRWATIVSPGEESFWMDPKNNVSQVPVV